MPAPRTIASVRAMNVPNSTAASVPQSRDECTIYGLRGTAVQYQRACPFLTQALAGLAWLGRQGTRALALSVFVGIALPPLAALLKHVFVEALLVLLALAFLRVEPASLRRQFRRPRPCDRGKPVDDGCGAGLLICGSAMALGVPQASQALFLALVLQAVAPPVIGSPALATLMGLDAALSLATLIVAMASTPLTVPLFAALFVGPGPRISPLALASR